MTALLILCAALTLALVLAIRSARTWRHESHEWMKLALRAGGVDPVKAIAAFKSTGGVLDENGRIRPELRRIRELEGRQSP